MNKNSGTIWRWLALLPALAVLFASMPALASADDQTPPAVARMSVISGDVVVRRGDSGSDVAANINAPLMADDYLSTRGDGRAEVQMDASDALRISADTQLRFTQVENAAHTLQIAQGTVELSVYRGLDGHPEIETPSVAIRPDEGGRYRVSVSANGVTEITVRAGRADIVTPQGTQALGVGSTLVAEGPASNPSFRSIETVAFDSFDQWNEERDRAIERALADHNVNQDMVGASDLDQYGHWVDVDGYGEVWQPNNEPAGWSPYSDGSWTWEQYYGWTWVGYEPWGWAPYHYGRWFYGANVGWAWYPGPAYVAPVWEPALVGFVGFGGGWGLSIGFGGGWGFGTIGWVPLGPWEPFHPWWGPGFWGGRWGGNAFVNNFNITRIYQNASAPHGVVGVPGRAFGDGNFAHIAPIAPSRFSGATAVHGPLPVAPTARNLAFNNHPVASGAGASPGRFGSFPSQPTAPGRSLTQDRQAIQSIAQRSAPSASGSERAGQTGGSEAGREAPGASSRPGEPSVGSHTESGAAASRPEGNSAAASRPEGGAAAEGPWNRFNAERGGASTSTSPDRAGTSGSSAEHATNATTREGPAAATHEGASGGDSWSRFGSSSESHQPATIERSSSGNPWSSNAWSHPASSARTQSSGSSGSGYRGWGGGYQSHPSSPGYSRPSAGSSHGYGQPASHPQAAPASHSSGGGGGGGHHSR